MKSQKGNNFTIAILNYYKLRVVLLYRSLIKFFRESVDLQFDEIRLGFHFRVREAGAGVRGGGGSGACPGWISRKFISRLADTLNLSLDRICQWPSQLPCRHWI